MKATLFGQRVQANASAFFYDYKDKQLSVYFADPIYTALSRINNVPDAEAYGLDTEVSWRVSQHFTAILGATFLHTEVQDYQGIDAAGQPADFDGNSFLYSPDASGSITLLYERPITAPPWRRSMSRRTTMASGSPRRSPCPATCPAA